MEIATWIEAIEPWHWLVFGLGLVLLDIFLTSSFFLLWIGFAIALNSLWDYLGLSGASQLLLIAIAAFFSAFGARAWLGHDQDRLPSGVPEELVGLRGRILTVSENDERDGRGAVQGNGEWLVRSTNTKLTIGAQFQVVGSSGMVLSIALDNSEIES